ncbi:hypothetical protein GCM10011322_34100 [Salinarimonas ramus]|uniref:Uncharacterized protein n=1 Tax=Salinarimonas ramus TaxID=690164 RepID=A0A917QCJ8_9HYPH|nr:hypothetical protein GCM10011322_34100 [Salinarimonas ramus]
MAERETRNLPDVQPAGAWEGSDRLPRSWHPDSVTVTFSPGFGATAQTAASKPRKRVFGAYRGRFSVPDDFFRPMSDDEIR